MRIFVDSDVVISSLFSKTGAAYLLLHCSKITPIFSNISVKELKIVAKRLDIKENKLENLLHNKFQIIKLKQPIKIKDFRGYVKDVNDIHIIVGAIMAKVSFLITYNMKHFEVEKIKRDYKIILMTPGNFLQYLRSF